MANFVNSKKYRDQQFILRKSAGNQLFAAFLVTYENWRRNWQILKNLKKMANFANSKKMADFANFEINGQFCEF